MSRPLQTIKCSNSLATDYVITSGYRVLLGESDDIELPLAPVPVEEGKMAAGGLNEGAEEYAEMHAELWERTKEYLKTI